MTGTTGTPQRIFQSADFAARILLFFDEQNSAEKKL